MISILEHIGMGVMGLLLYNVFSLKKHLKLIHTNTFWEAYKDSGKYMISLWGFAIISLISIIIYVSPETAAAISQLTGMDVAQSNAAFFTMGLMATSLADTK